MANEAPYPVNVKLQVKPIVIVPEAVPTKLGEQLPTRAEAARNGDEQVQAFRHEVTQDATILEPAVIETWEDVLALQADAQTTDAYWVLGAGRGRARLILELARRYEKPLVGGGGVGLPPFLRSRNLEAYSALTDELISSMRVRKAIGQTRILQARSRMIPSCLSSAWNFEDLETRFKVGFEALTDEELFSEATHQDHREEAEALADDLISHAEHVNLTRDYVQKGTSLYLTVKSLLKQHGCNAFTPRCCEAPYLQLETEYQATPCLALTLLNDQGLPASCQGDISALLTVMLMMYTSRKSIFMGNIGYPEPGENFVVVNHSAPGLKMEGLEAPRVPYSLDKFGVVDWGPALYVDMPEGKEVTLARLDPLVHKLLVTKGEVVKSVRIDKHCKQMTYINLPVDARDFVEEAHTNYGGHFTVVYGDYTRKLSKLGALLKIESEPGR